MSRTRVVAVVFALLAVVILAGPALALPAFARRYGISCQQCHQPIPKLKPYGATFAGNGFRMTPGEQPPDMVQTGDDLLMVPKALPLGIRADAQMGLITSDDETVFDFQTLWTLKILSSASISRNLSYYFYYLLNERGDTGGVEDAFVYWNDIGGKPVDLAAGQFQVSDPIFKRELRLELADYMIYRTRVGAQLTDLSYDRGLQLTWSPSRVTATFEVVNGNGIGGVDETTLTYDDNPCKNVLGHVRAVLVPDRLQLGALGFYGRQRAWVDDGEKVCASTWMAGADAIVDVAPFQLNAQYIHREDTRPTFTPGEPDAKTDGGFAELLWLPTGSRWYGFALYNIVDCDQPLLLPGAGWPDATYFARVQTLSGGAGYLVMRNFRMQFEAGWDIEQEAGRFTLGFSTAY